MYDNVKCEYPLLIEGANDLLFQTKSLDNMMLDLFVINVDGTLFEEKYDIEDHSDKTLPEDDMRRLFGCMSRVNQRLVPLDHTGEIRFYNYDVKTKRWLEFSSYFLRGKLQQLNLVRNEIH